jgi:hypothetical protein
MFNIFRARRSKHVEIARSPDDLLKRMGKKVALRQGALDALGERHGDLDMDLVTRISEILTPLLGADDSSEDSKWFQSMDWYGDGIRHLEFQPSAFPMSVIPELHKLLVGDYESFGILCWAPVVDKGDAGSEGVVIFNDTLLVTRGLVGISEHA